MRYSINGVTKQKAVLYGRHVIFTYEAICKQAGVPADAGVGIMYKYGNTVGAMNAGERAIIPNDAEPEFKVLVG